MLATVEVQVGPRNLKAFVILASTQNDPSNPFRNCYVLCILRNLELIG